MKMQKRLVITMALAMVMVFTIAAGVMAQNTKFPAYVSGIQVANLQNEPATVTLTAYNADGTTNGNPISSTRCPPVAPRPTSR